MTDTLSLLGDLGLTGYQARVLVALAEHGPGRSEQIAAWSGVPRTSVYQNCEALVKLGLVVELDRDGGRHRSARWQFVGWGPASAELVQAEDRRHREKRDAIGALCEHVIAEMAREAKS